ncbi:hypothetical protein ACI6Q2_23535, partial [Chitinophagaceae bacterium LWZ2-11]
GRLLTVTKTIGDDVNTKRTIVRNEYDAMGQLLHKQIGQKTINGAAPSATPLEDQVYSYNIRGWLKGINRQYGGSAPPAPNVDYTNSKWFSMDLSYDWGF